MGKRLTTETEKAAMERKPLSTSIILIFSALLVVGALYVAGVWDAAILEQSRKAVELAEAAEAGLLGVDAELIEELRYGTLPSGYALLKEKLIYLTKLDNEIRFAYIMYMHRGNIYFAVDSELEDSPDYSPPGQLYGEADAFTHNAFFAEEAVVTKPAPDRWGEWVSVLVPIKDLESGETIAVFGADYPAETWASGAVSRAIEAGLMVISVLSVIAVLHVIVFRNKQLRQERNKLLASEKRLRESDTMLRTIFDQVQMGVALVHNERFTTPDFGEFPTANPKFLEILGRSMEDLSDLRWDTITHPEDLAADLEQFARFKSGAISGYSMEKRFLRPSGDWVWVNMTISSLYLGAGTDAVHLCVIDDISHRKAMEQILFDSERSKSVLLDNMPGMAYRCRYDRDWTMEFVSQGCRELTGYDPESLLNNRDLSFNDLITPEYRKVLWNRWKEVLDVKGKLQEEYQITTADGSNKWVWEQGQGIYDDSGKLVALEGLILDIDDRKKQELRLRYINSHDDLSGLYNRHYFQELFNDDTMRRAEAHRTVILVNIRKFSLLNNAYRYTYGDQLIRKLAGELERLIRSDRVLCHISIDRFVLYLKHDADRTELDALCRQIIDILEELLAPHTLGANLGVVEIGETRYDADTVIKNASIAANAVAPEENFGACYYNSTMADAVARENILKNELTEEAYRDRLHQLQLVYQPIVAAKSGAIVSFEALARFRSERFGLIQPAEFIPIAEETQLIVPLGKSIIREACLALERFSAASNTPISISVNVSAIQLLREDFISNLLEILRETGADPGRLGLELTETSFARTFDEMNRKFQEIRNAGIQLYIDDFGIGYSSLAREAELNVDYLKIDKFFIDKLTEIEPDKLITKDIISMAHKMGHTTVAEGVEHPRQRDLLVDFGCDLLQGYLFSRPVPLDEALAFLTNNKDES